MSSKVPYPLKVFLNIPYEEEYRDFEEALIVTCICYGFHPLLAENFREGRYRRERIMKAMADCKYAITDLSSDGFNMPYELGLLHCMKTPTLVLERGHPDDYWRYQRVFSDILGEDPKRYNCDFNYLVKILNTWFKNDVKVKDKRYRKIATRTLLEMCRIFRRTSESPKIKDLSLEEKIELFEAECLEDQVREYLRKSSKRENLTAKRAIQEGFITKKGD